MKHPYVDNLVTLNKVVNKLYGGPKRIVFPRLESLDELTIVCYADASYANLPDKKSSGRGYVIFLYSRGKACVLTWQSNKVKRVVHSTFAAETLSLVDALGDAIYLKTLLSELLYNSSSIKIIPIIGIIDNKQLHDSIYSTKSADDKRLRIDLAEIQEMLEKGEVTQIKWVPTQDNISDCLTKKGVCADKLNSVLETGELEF